jgi:hypothetical protein
VVSVSVVFVTPLFEFSVAVELSPVVVVTVSV